MEGKTLTLFEDMITGLDEVDAFLAGKTTGYRVTLPAEVDVKAIRKRLNMTQSRFSDTFGFSLDAVKHWEGGRRTPESSARAFLTVIARDPKAVISALHQPAEANVTRAATKVAAGKKDRLRRPTKTEVSARRSARAR
jgi:putative transcriptional regulator